MRNVARVTILVAYEQHDRRFDLEAAERLVDDVNAAIAARFDSSLEDAVLESVEEHFADTPMIDTSSWTDYGYEYDAELGHEWWNDLYAPFVGDWQSRWLWHEAES